MNFIAAAIIALAGFPVPPPGPALDQLCMSPAFHSAHQAECSQAINPPDYN